MLTRWFENIGISKLRRKKNKKLRFRYVDRTSYDFGTCFVRIVIVFDDGKA